MKQAKVTRRPWLRAFGFKGSRCMWWSRKRRRHADQRPQRRVDRKNVGLCHCVSWLQVKISQMEVVEDFESRPHKAVSFCGRERERQGSAGMK